MGELLKSQLEFAICMSPFDNRLTTSTLFSFTRREREIPEECHCKKMSGLVRFAGLSLLRGSPQLLAARQLRAISTSPKNRETVAIPKEQTKTEEAKSSTNKNWVSYGFSSTDQAEDRNTMKSSFFFSITLCIVWGTMMWAYLPDIHLRDWSQREAYLALRRREAAGQDPISRDYIDAGTMVLPAEEELGAIEIII